MIENQIWLPKSKRRRKETRTKKTKGEERQKGKFRIFKK